MGPVVVISFYKKTYGIKSVNEVAIFVSKSFSKRSFLDFDTKRYSSMSELISLEKRFHRFIRSACRIQSQFRSEVKKVHTR
jgi:hypothetical protein